SAGSSAVMSHSPTVTSPLTVANVILGTAAYMAPEQVRGKAVDRRADIWAFGCVFYECLTGHRAFMGGTVPDILAKILESDPDLAALPSGTPPRVKDVLQRCFVKDPKLRLRDIGDARIVLDEALAARSPSGRLLMTEVPGAGVAVRHSPSAGIAIAGAVGVAIGAVLWGTFGPRPAADSREPRCVTLTMPPDVTVNGVQLSPDGRMLVVRGRPKTPEGSVAARDRLYA